MVNENASATQTQVNASVTNLQAAIANLIPTTQVNSTELYEAWYQYSHAGWGNSGIDLLNPIPVDETNTTADSLAAFRASLDSAKTLLNSLYDENGAPTGKNTSTGDAGAALRAEMDAAIADIREAADKLDRLTDESNVYLAQMAYNGINLYANTLYRDAMSGDAAYRTARETALAFYQSHAAPSAGLGQKAYEEYVAAFNAIRSAYYALADTKESITVSLSVVDAYAALKGAEPQFGAEKTVTLPSNATVSDLLNAAGVSLPASANAGGSVLMGRTDTAYGLYVNGVFLHEATTRTPNSGILPQFKDYGLRDGDKVVIALMAVPADGTVSMQGTIPRELMQVASSIRSMTLRADTAEVKAGSPLTVTATAARASTSHYSPQSAPLTGGAVFISAPCATEAEARAALLTTDTGARTDGSGQASFTLYEEGWYLVNVFDPADNGGLCNGSSILVRVTTPSDLSAIRAKLLDELKACYETYPEGYYTAADWSAVETAYTQAVAAINAASTSGAMADAQKAALSTIQEIQARTTATNGRSMDAFTTILDILPDNAADLTSNYAHLFEDFVESGSDYAYNLKGLISCYAALTDWQKSQLTGLQQAKYDALVAAYQAGNLPGGQAYRLSLKVQGDSEAATAALRDMMEKLQGYYDGTNRTTEYTFNQFYTFRLLPNGGAFSTTKAAADTSEAGKVVNILTDVGCSSYEWLNPEGIDPNRADGKGKNFTANIKGAGNVITGTGWSIGAESLTRDSYRNGQFIVGSNVTVKLGDAEYVVKSITVDGVDNYTVSNAALPTQINTGDSGFLGRSLYFPDGLYSFVMPQNDVEITITWGPKDATGSELDAIKASAKSAIEAAYAGYSSTNYSSENWTTLTAAKTNGLAAVDAAETADNVRIARQSTLAAMAAVKKLSSGGDPGTTVKLPDYGKTVGQVYVSVENNTFPGGAFTDTILEGWYDLCERDTMMTSILKALKTEGYSWSGTGGDDYSITYLSSIYKDTNGNGQYDKGEPKLGEFDGEPGSGWMGTLNDWFTNEGFASFGVQKSGNYALANGDIIKVVYTQNLGVDVGGTWGNSDTSLKALEIKGGTLTPSFNGDMLTYNLTIPGDTATITVTPTAANKNYLVKTFLNTYNSDAAFYKRTESISVKSGDTIYVGVGEKAWPSMNKQGEEARDYTGTKYTIKVYSGGKDGIQAQINALPNAGKITLSNYKSYQETVSAIRKAYDALSDKSGMTITKLTEAEAKITFYQQIDNMKSQLAALPNSTKATDAEVRSAQSAIEAADRAYKALSDEQKKYITISDAANYNALVERLSKLVTTSAGTITGSDKMPETSTDSEQVIVEIKPEATVNSKGEATATVTDKELNSTIAQAKTDGADTIVIAPEVKGDATKVSVELPKSAVGDIVKDTGAALSVKTDVGTVTIPAKSLEDLSKQSGSKVTVSAESLKNTDGKANGQTKIEIAVDGRTVEKVAGGVTVAVPAADAKPGSVLVLVTDEGAKLIKKSALDGETLAGIVDGSCTVRVVDNAKPFADTENHWAKDAVAFASSHELFSGTAAGTFSPNAPMNRAMLATVLYRLEDAKASGSADFHDVPSGTWYTDAVAWASQSGIVSGTGNGFNPNGNVTREQLATMLYRYAKTLGMDTAAKGDLTKFSDGSKTSNWAKDAMQWAVGSGLLSGKGGSIVDPTGPATRAEVAAIMQRMVGLMVK